MHELGTIATAAMRCRNAEPKTRDRRVRARERHASDQRTTMLQPRRIDEQPAVFLITAIFEVVRNARGSVGKFRRLDRHVAPLHGRVLPRLNRRRIVRRKLAQHQPRCFEVRQHRGTGGPVYSFLQ